jgi:uncharacterized protein YndB with AHSA1/START domain
MPEPSTEKRSVEIVTHIAAPVDALWKALTDAQELTRWFPLEARVKPGVGGSIFTSWRNEHQWESPIAIWEPNRRLRVLWCPADTPEPEQFGVDYFLHAQEDGTAVLRLIHFGFGVDAKWDEMLDGVSRGWSHMVWTLKHYLERHRGEPRGVVYVRARLEEAQRDAVWRRFFSEEGLFPQPSLVDARPGERFRVHLTTGDEAAGTVRSNLPGKNFDAKIESLGDSVLNVQIHRSKDGEGFLLQLTFSTFGLEPDRVARMEKSWQAAVDRAADVKGTKP